MKQIFSLFALLLSFGYSGKAQIAFSKKYGGVENEDGRWMEQMPDSGFILTGMTNTYSNGQQMFGWFVQTHTATHSGTNPSVEPNTISVTWWNLQVMADLSSPVLQVAMAEVGTMAGSSKQMQVAFKPGRKLWDTYRLTGIRKLSFKHQMEGMQQLVSITQQARSTTIFT